MKLLENWKMYQEADIYEREEMFMQLLTQKYYWDGNELDDPIFEKEYSFQERNLRHLSIYQEGDNLLVHDVYTVPAVVLGGSSCWYYITPKEYDSIVNWDFSIEDIDKMTDEEYRYYYKI